MIKRYKQRKKNIMDPIEPVNKQSKPKRSVRTPREASSAGFSAAQKEGVDLQKTPFLFFPPGKEMLFLAIYFAVLPYITGLIFLFFYISEGKASIFKAIGVQSNFFLVWTIGYEILATLVVVWIIATALRISIRNSKKA